MKKGTFIAFTMATAVALVSGSAFADGNAKKGKKLWKKCKACHDTKPGKHKVGPSLAGIYGKKAGQVDGFTKYKGLKGADFEWDEDNLSDWIKDPKAFLKDKGLPPKTTMNVKIKKEKDRENLVAYMKTL